MVFSSFSGTVLLSWFLDHPTRKIHFNELCRETKLSPLTTKSYCEEFLGHGWISEERTANLRFFSLNNSSFVARAIKRAHFLEKLRKEGIGQIVDENAVSFALYGSHASGEYDERSDIDLIVIGRKEQVHYEHTKGLEKRLGRQVQITVISLEKWEKNKQDPFAQSVISNHVLLGGAAL